MTAVLDVAGERRETESDVRSPTSSIRGDQPRNGRAVADQGEFHAGGVCDRDQLDGRAARCDAERLPRDRGHVSVIRCDGRELNPLEPPHDVLATAAEEIVQREVLAVEQIVGCVTARIRTCTTRRSGDPCSGRHRRSSRIPRPRRRRRPRRRSRIRVPAPVWMPATVNLRPVTSA